MLKGIPEKYTRFVSQLNVVMIQVILISVKVFNTVPNVHLFLQYEQL